MVTVRTPQGLLIGERSKAGDIAIFRGIPYAEPPVGALRWKHARDLLAWDGERAALAFSADCHQPATMAFTAEPENDPFFHPSLQQSEDCLYLNVWTPDWAIQSRAGLPVMVWIHGGAYVQGSGSWPLYDGSNLARKGAVVVTFNYRVGIFGFFSFGDAAHLDCAGNFGLSDQISLLRWVRRSIASFGGDPDKVTIFGESAGAAAISELMSSPLARGLFHRAAAQSGGSFAPMQTATEAAAAGRAFAQTLGMTSLAELQAAPAETLLHATRSQGFRQAAVVDGNILPRSVFDAFDAGQHARVPLIVGFNRDEVFGILPSPRTRHDYERGIVESYGPFADRILSLYPSETWDRSYQVLMTYEWYGWAVQTWARCVTQWGGAAYLYCFAHLPQGSDVVFHTAEIPFVFNNERDSPRYSVNLPRARATDLDIGLADMLSDYWLSFAATGDPNGTMRPVWPRYEHRREGYLRIENGCCSASQFLLPGAWDLHSDVVRWRSAK